MDTDNSSKEQRGRMIENIRIGIPVPKIIKGVTNGYAY